ncbi:tetratricopeptide repeat protein [Nanoarchaeota archaeon]
MKKLLVIFLLLLVACAQSDDVQDDVTNLNNLGVYYSDQGEPDKAIEYFEQVLDIETRHEFARKNLALLYFNQNNFNMSMYHFNILTNYYPNNPSYHYDLGISIAENCRLKSICDLPSAIKEFQRADELEPGYEMAIENIDALVIVMQDLNSTS